jgi:hypothetical protein
VGPKNSRGGKLLEATRDPSHPDFGATFFRPIEDAQDGVEEDDEEGNGGTNNQMFRLCVQCGELARGSPNCGHRTLVRVVKEAPPAEEDRADQMAKCGACGYNAAGRDPVREVVYGADGPHAVIATTLYEALERKKVLAFADGRQEAAFFAWYLEDSYRDILNRNLILKAAQRLCPGTQEGLSLQELASGLRDLFRERKVFPPATGDLDLRRRAWSTVYREFLTEEPRISLGGVGLVRWRVKWPGWFETVGVLRNAPWSLSEPEIQDLIFTLLDSMRADRAVDLRTEGSVLLGWSDLGLQTSQMRVGIGLPKRRIGVRSWDGKAGKRARLLTKVLIKTLPGLSEDEATQQGLSALRSVWDKVRQCDENAPTSRDRLLISADDARRLNPDWWRLQLVPDDSVLFQCNTCGRLQDVSIRGVCARHRCPGPLRAVCRKELEPNHYRSLYEEDLPATMRVEEHTAQLDKETAREFQRDFKSGKINVLSSSTTFELGVDLATSIRYSSEISLRRRSTMPSAWGGRGAGAVTLDSRSATVVGIRTTSITSANPS